MIKLNKNVAEDKVAGHDRNVELEEKATAKLKQLWKSFLGLIISNRLFCLDGTLCPTAN